MIPLTKVVIIYPDSSFILQVTVMVLQGLLDIPNIQPHGGDLRRHGGLHALPRRDDGVRGVHARPHLVQVHVHRVHGRREVFHVALAGQDDATDVVHLTWKYGMEYGMGWRLYMECPWFSMIFLGYFFCGKMWEDDEVSGMCSSCDLEIGVFTYNHKDMYFWARAGQSWRAHVGTNRKWQAGKSPN